MKFNNILFLRIFRVNLFVSDYFNICCLTFKCTIIILYMLNDMRNHIFSKSNFNKMHCTFTGLIKNFNLELS